MKAAVRTNSTSNAVLAMGKEARPPARGVRVTDATRAQHLHHHPPAHKCARCFLTCFLPAPGSHTSHRTRQMVRGISLGAQCFVCKLPVAYRPCIYVNRSGAMLAGKTLRSPDTHHCGSALRAPINHRAFRIPHLPARARRVVLACAHLPQEAIGVVSQALALAKRVLRSRPFRRRLASLNFTYVRILCPDPPARAPRERN